MSLDLDKQEWKRVALHEVVRHITDRVEAEASGLERFLAGEHIPSGCLAISDWGIIGRDPIGPMFYKRFKPDHVLYVSRRTYLRKVAVPEFEGVTGEKTFVLETIDTDLLLQEFLPFVLSSERFHAYAIANSRGSVNPYLNWGELAAYEFDLPPISDQKRLAKLLWAIEGHRRALVARQERVSSGVDALREASFNEVEGPRESLGAVCTIAAGSAFPHRFQGIPGGSVPVLKVSDLGDADEVSTAANLLTDAAISEMRAKVWPAGTVLFPKVGAALLTERRRVLAAPAAFDNNIMGLVPGERVRPHFVLQFMKTVRLGQVAQTGVIPSVNNAHIRSIKIPIPNPERQDEIIARMERSARALRLGWREICNLSAVRSSLLAQIFGGE